MPDENELPELQPLAEYDERWMWLAVAALVFLVLYVLGVLLWARLRRPKPKPAVVPAPPPGVRELYLARLAEIEREHAQAKLPARVAHLRLSETVRAFVEDVSGLATSAMTLSDLRGLAAPGPLIRAIELTYPPTFAPAEIGGAEAALAGAFEHARALVRDW